MSRLEIELIKAVQNGWLTLNPDNNNEGLLTEKGEAEITEITNHCLELMKKHDLDFDELTIMYNLTYRTSVSTKEYFLQYIDSICGTRTLSYAFLFNEKSDNYKHLTAVLESEHRVKPQLKIVSDTEH